jgi:hypothetical protein
MMTKLHLALAAAAIAALTLLDMSGPASARWKDWPNSGYCPAGTCTAAGYWRAYNVNNCRARPICRWSKSARW